MKLINAFHHCGCAMEILNVAMAAMSHKSNAKMLVHVGAISQLNKAPCTHLPTQRTMDRIQYASTASHSHRILALSFCLPF